ncbi:hypothetical protein PGT21_022272 [Puccinia graminis f. sp. tritici]|uniref:Uncharacterized protein n=1 Tax=Puccinia graminis f. sp. tritici TaxID=56615 RepID=A0A5B0NUP6_PUCGR|nr:hypothetical protein PGT21_022272 [Puccinia graminis f. sp. tritici]
MSSDRSTTQAPEASKQLLAVAFSIASGESSHQDPVVPKSTLEPVPDTSIEPNNQKEGTAITLPISATTPNINDQNSTVQVDQAVLADPTNHTSEDVTHIPNANISDVSLANVQHTSLDSTRQERPLADERDTLVGTTNPQDPTVDVADATPLPTEEEEQQHRRRLLDFIEQAHARGHRDAVMMFTRMLYPELNSSLPEEPVLDLTGRRPAQYIYSPTSPYGYRILEQGIYFVPGLVAPFSAEDMIHWPQPEPHLPQNDRFRKLKKQKKKKRKQRSYNRKLIITLVSLLMRRM